MPALGFLLSGRYCSLRLDPSDEGSSNRHDRNLSGAFVLDITRTINGWMDRSIKSNDGDDKFYSVYSARPQVNSS